MNSSDGITRSRDKLIAFQMMSAGNIPVPITAQVVSWEDTNRAINRVGGTPCVVKSTEGTHGSGVFLAHTDQHARQLVYQMLERGYETFSSRIYRRISWKRYSSFGSWWKCSSMHA